MSPLLEIDVPSGFNWKHWVDRWDRMQDRYVARRHARFARMAWMIRETQGSPSRVLNLGCGPGSLMAVLLESFPDAEIVGIDFDPTMLLLARERFARVAGRVELILADLRDASWSGSLTNALDAVVSATALHWLKPGELAHLYRQVARVLRPGGIFLNADHVASDSPSIQKAWELHREQERAAHADPTADDWHGFWDAYGRALNLDVRTIHNRVVGAWEGGVEEGMPLAWHFEELRAGGFQSVDCFWRCDGDAIYGGVRGTDESR